MTQKTHLAILLAGGLLGLLLSPNGLGRWGPGWYESWFVGAGQSQETLDEYNRETDQQIKRLAQTGVTSTAIEELQHRRKEKKNNTL